MSTIRIPPFLRAEELHPDMHKSMRPKVSFFVAPSLYRIVDGDTIAIMAPDPEARRGQRQTAFSIRLHAIDAWEVPKRYSHDEGLKAAGITPYRDNAGWEARDYFRNLCKWRALYIEPQTAKDGSVVDKFGRLLANVSVSGTQTTHFHKKGAFAVKPTFDIAGAFAIEPILVQKGFARVMKGRQMPPTVPSSLLTLKHELDVRNEIKKSIEAGGGSPQEIDSEPTSPTGP